jgi:pyroglutamyl-peptidase
MPTTSEQPKASFRALVTGFRVGVPLCNASHHDSPQKHPQPFYKTPSNPSWLTVAPLHDTIIETPSASIHVTAVGPLKVAYRPVLSVVADLHARPPRLPNPGSEVLAGPPPKGPVVPPPPEGYDFVLHLGQGRQGGLSIVQVGHKSGYLDPGVDGEGAPDISIHNTKFPNAPSPTPQFETSRISQFAASMSLSCGNCG